LKVHRRVVNAAVVGAGNIFATPFDGVRFVATEIAVYAKVTGPRYTQGARVLLIRIAQNKKM
jgi:hypothetical protein